MFRVSSPLSDAPWYKTVSGSLHQGSVSQMITAIDEAAKATARERPVIDLSTAECVETGVVIQLAELVERGQLNLVVQLGRLVPALPARLAAVLGESQVEARETLLGHIKQRREQGLEDCDAIRAMLTRWSPAHAE